MLTDRNITEQYFDSFKFYYAKLYKCWQENLTILKGKKN